MSIDDSRTPAAGGSTDSGYFTPSEQRYTAYDSDDTTDFDDDVVATREPHKWHFGADLGLLVLRVVLGAMLVGHGLQKVFGIMQGPGIDGFAKFLGTLGFQQTTLLAWATGVTELTSGSLLILGLFTPAAAAGALGVVASAIWVRLDVQEFLGAVEVEGLYAAGAFALLFAGAGKISLDRNTPWFRRAPAFGFVFLVLAIGLSVAALIVLR